MKLTFKNTSIPKKGSFVEIYDSIYILANVGPDTHVLVSLEDGGFFMRPVEGDLEEVWRDVIGDTPYTIVKGVWE